MTGRALLNDPRRNKGTAFTRAERKTYALEGLLPARVETMAEQCARLRNKFDRLHDDLERHVFLRALQDTNQTLFYGFVDGQLDEMLPILYTPTVGLACEEFSHIYRRPLGLFVSYPDRDRMTAQFDALDDDVDVIVVTDGERILGLGDQGLGGMGIPIGKLSLYTAAGGVDPGRTLPIFLDAGTNNQQLLDDPLYLGWRHERIVGADYDEFVERFVEALVARFPRVLLQWEDFAGHHATTLLNRYRDRVLSFNDDIQGTAAVTLAAIHSAAAVTGSTLADQRICIVGAGSAGTGIAGMLADAIAAEGVDDPESQLFLTDASGLLHDRRDDLVDFQQRFAQPWARVAEWATAEGPTTLETVVTHARPTVLIGVSGQGGLFSRSVIMAMADATERPIVMPLSNPTSHAEATPADLMKWTDGRALIATGSPFEPVVHDGVTHTISQSNNIYVFPGIGQGARISNATTITDAMLRAAAIGVADQSPCRSGASAEGVLPALDQVQAVSKRIALAVAQAARAEGVGDDVADSELERRLDRAWWTPVYQPFGEEALR
ncbi:NAD-dependent malic enzyme [Nocardioides salsibiostraticola]